MKPFERLDAVVVPLDRANVDTDAIIPKQFMKALGKRGLGIHLFDEWRYLDPGELGMVAARRLVNADFVLNDRRFQGARILLTRANFGCGSSREHAVWALEDYGIRVLIAPSFAEIFRDNCLKNGLLPICFDEQIVDALFATVAASPGAEFSVSLADQTVELPDCGRFAFDIGVDSKRRLMLGLDDVALTLANTDRILAYESWRRTLEPWLFEAS